MAKHASDGPRAIPGVEVLNEVNVNQVLFRFADDASTSAALAEVQRSGAVWMSGTKVDGRAAIRLSISNWQTSDADIARLVDAFAE